MSTVNMSPDTIFAAQMWAWPDAIIKRDANGAVLFVNAAFLGLYGGQVHDWQGNAVTGWNAPPAAGQSMRFETRMPGTEGEIVYDWLESAMADGTSLAVARNVTDILPKPGVTTTPDAPQIDAQAFLPPVEEAAAPAFEPVMEAPTAPPLMEIPAETAPAQEIPVAEAPAVPATEIDIAPAASVAIETPAVAEATQAAPISTVADQAPVAPVETTVEAPMVDRRMQERRTLPIEDESAVLGNNWRDAVIAKAVGATGAAAPETEANEEAAPLATETRGEGEPIRILLAEDNAINALLTRTLLEAEGCHVDTVEDGQLAVEAIRVNRYDLIFMDMRMPNMDGLDSTRKIRSMDHRSKGLPIIALTANAFDDDRNACFDAGMNDFMTKPVSAEELSEMVERWTSEDAKLAATG